MSDEHSIRDGLELLKKYVYSELKQLKSKIHGTDCNSKVTGPCSSNTVNPVEVKMHPESYRLIRYKRSHRRMCSAGTYRKYKRPPKTA